ncbi:MAG: hypothetical protein GQ553_03985 [Nitrosomonadaceae bacterium]|nr:hypothetical protein [Nitrosomonadaceae bacterium]
MDKITQTVVLNHIHDAKRRLEEAEGLVRASAGNGAFTLLSYCKTAISNAMKGVPVTSIDYIAGFGGSKRTAGERSGL